jgi:hypothetical protein
MYLQGSKTLILRFPQDENRPVTKIPGATLVFKRDVLNKVQFPNQSVGEDDLFCIRSKRKGYKVYSAGKYNFVAIRRKNSLNHTWIISDKELIAHHRTIPNVQNYKKFVRRKPSDVVKICVLHIIAKSKYKYRFSFIQYLSFFKHEIQHLILIL